MRSAKTARPATYSARCQADSSHDREHDRLRAPRGHRTLGHARVRAAQRQSPLSRGGLPPAGRAARRRGRTARPAARSSCSAARSTAASATAGRRAPTARCEIDAAALQRVLAAVHVSGRRPAAGGPPVNALDVLRWPGVVREDSAAAARHCSRPRASVFGETLDGARRRAGARGRRACASCSSSAARDSRRWWRACGARLPEVQARVRTRLTSAWRS